MARLLIPMDGSQLAECVLQHARAFARAFDVDICLLHVVGRDPQHSTDEFDWGLRQAESLAYLKGIERKFEDLPVTVESHIVGGNTAEAIIEFAKSHHIDLIILSAYGRGGLTQFPYGSTVQKVVSRARQSILLVRPTANSRKDAQVRNGRILVAFDGSQRSRWALCLAATMARANGVGISILRVVQTPESADLAYENAEAKQLFRQLTNIASREATRQLEDLQARLLAGLDVRTQILSAPAVVPVIEQCACADDIGLLILSSHSDGDGNGHAQGPISEMLLAHCKTPTLVFQDGTGRRPVFRPRSQVEFGDSKVMASTA